MNSALQKSPIPDTHAFVAKALRQSVFDPNWHFHPEYQIFMVSKGSGTRFIGDHVQPFKKGEITFTGPDLPHLWRSDTKGPTQKNDIRAEGIVVYFQDNFIGENLMQKEEAIKVRQLFKRSLRGMDITGKTAQNVQKMLLKLLKLKGFDRVLQLMKILNCMAQSEETELLASAGYTNTQKEGDTERMNRIYAHVMQCFTQTIRISEVAALAHMTPTSFSRYFKVHANKTFSEFVSEIRIGHACKLLIEKKTNVSLACYASGFQTLSNFNRQFKKITKRTPLDYKREYLLNQ